MQDITYSGLNAGHNTDYLFPALKNAMQQAWDRNGCFEIGYLPFRSSACKFEVRIKCLHNMARIFVKHGENIKVINVHQYTSHQNYWGNESVSDEFGSLPDAIERMIAHLADCMIKNVPAIPAKV